MTESAEVVTLGKVLAIRLSVVGVFVDHEGVSQFDVKIRSVF